MDPDAPDEGESDDDMYVDLENDDFEDLGFDDCKSLEFLDLSLFPICKVPRQKDLSQI